MQLRSKITALALSAGLAVAGIAGLAGPAGAADTTTTFTLTGGALAITAPASASLGSVATGTATTSAQLGTVTVADARGALLATWSSSVASTDYTTGGATANETIVKANADYWSGPAVGPTGVAVRVPGQLTSANKVALDVSRTAFSATGVIGNNTTPWNPTVIVNIPSSAVVGAYTGTITHSVA